MVPLVAQNLPAIRTLCAKYGITRLELFGSAATGKFDPSHSDVDFLYDIETMSPGLADRYFNFADELKALLGREVDLVCYEQVTNRFLKAQIDEERVTIHAA